MAGRTVSIVRPPAPLPSVWATVAEAGPLAVKVCRLGGGRSEGTSLVQLIAGDTRVILVPERGLGIWKMFVGGVELGWQSPVTGPVHPSFVPLAEPSGLGWLDGFDELVARCGLVSNGAPDFDANGRLRHGLHGRIANLPAHEVSATIDEGEGTVTVTGAVDETRFLCHALRLETRLMLRLDRPRIEWTDTVTNRSDRPSTMQLLYHVNLGPPLLGAGAECVAAIEELAPRDAAAVGDVPSWNRYDPPRAGRGEEVHFARLRTDAGGIATAMLVAPDASQAAALSWRAATLPCFSLWKNQGGEAGGYVTGLEPGTNYPNPRSFEEAQGRVVPLEPGESAAFDLALEHLSGGRLTAVRDELAALTTKPGLMHAAPKRGWSAG
jgi:hypothetical protein